MVGGEGREVLDGVLRGLVAHQDGDLGDPDGLGHTLGIHKLLVSVIRDLVVDWRKPVNIIFVVKRTSLKYTAALIARGRV